MMAVVVVVVAPLMRPWSERIVKQIGRLLERCQQML
jgi:hypothetical protein